MLLMRPFRSLALLLGLSLVGLTSASAAEPPEGFRALFNGKDLTGWHGMPHFDPRKLAAMSEEDRAAQLATWQKDTEAHWTIQGDAVVNDGHGPYLTTDESFTDYELLIEYKTVPLADSGIYLKNTPQVQIWDSTEEKKFNLGANLGSGGLWNNSAGAPGKDPAVLADKPFGEWNAFRVRQIGSRTSVWLNDKLVVDHAIMENYWNREVPLFPNGQIQLQTHGGEIQWRNIFIREIAPEEANNILREKSGEGFTSLSGSGDSLDGWAGAVENYEIVDGSIGCKKGHGGVLFTKENYGDFQARLEIKLPAGGNNGLAIRYPGQGDPAYAGMCELQVLDTEDARYAKIDPRQAHGSAYGMIAAHRGYLRQPGEWNFQVVTVKGSTVHVELNGTVILSGDLATVTEYMANHPHPGKDLKEGHFGFAGHGDAVQFRNVEIKRLD
ncbi:MAG: DUF1080 domain-containing protein [Planctomycetaceae bacterium]